MYACTLAPSGYEAAETTTKLYRDSRLTMGCGNPIAPIRDLPMKLT